MLLAKEKAGHYQVEDKGRKTRKKVKTIRKYKRNPKVIIVFLIIVGFLAGLFLASKYAQLAISGYQIGKMKDSLAILQMENEQLKLEVAKMQSLSRIETIALEELGMTKPEGIQYVAVEPLSVKDTSGSSSLQVAMGEEKPARQENTFIRAMADVIGTWSGNMTKAEAGGR